MIPQHEIFQAAPDIWEIPKSFRSDMRVPVRVYISSSMLPAIIQDRSLEQLINVACLPGIEDHALAMPDIHQGYGFPIGGVAALRTSDGVISPGGVGYDINCGVRLLASPFVYQEIRGQIDALTHQIQRSVPSGVGRGGAFILDGKEIAKVLNTGVKWAMKRGLATAADAQNTEEQGTYRTADACCVSDDAKNRGRDQLGTLGSGNHFIELQRVVKIYDPESAEVFGLFEDQVAVMIHTGSRGLGHQICTDYVRLMNNVRSKYGIDLPDRELACAPFLSEEGQSYFKAMAAAANFAWVNRQVITHEIRSAWKQILGTPDADKLFVVYDVAHNIAKLERHRGKEYIVHRKGATRAFGPGSEDLPKRYQRSGQPVLIPGSMGTYSYVLAGTSKGMEDTFGSACHGAGRQMSRKGAKKNIAYAQLRKELEDYGVVVHAGSAQGLVEEAPQAYKDIESVIDVVRTTGIATPVAKLKPIGVVKG